MPRGVATKSYRSVQVQKGELNKFLKHHTSYSETTKQAIRAVLLEGKTYKEAGLLHNVTRQRVFNRVKNCIERMGVPVPEVAQSPKTH